jgi:predicted cupin superfamily sugar epimerase
MKGKADYWIKKLGLIRHPEGGYYRESYRSDEMIAVGGLPVRFSGGERSFSTAIYFLLAGNDFSAFHRLHSDELWHFYTGEPLTIHALDETGGYSPWTLGSNAEKGEAFQVVIKAGSWFGASLEQTDSFALVGCTVAPGFDFRDFEMGDRSELIRLYPGHRSLIEQLTRAGG